MPKSPLSERLLSRGAGAGLSRRSMADGGEVYTGGLANRALKTLGARAMTMDGTIFVDDQFDASKPQDLALYAHERHHQSESGGSDVHGARDSEEIAARAIERMVLHRAEKGMDVSQILRDAMSGNLQQAAVNALNDTPSGDDRANAWLGYQALRAQGKSHAEVVHELADAVMRAHSRKAIDHVTRTTEHRKF